MNTAFRTWIRCVAPVLAWLGGGACLLMAASNAGPAGIETIDLFNGRDLTGWKGDPRFWSVEEGAITG
ncbi:MAG: hypothetical protein D6766_02335, partial [Verrucomicrobia bacterium]